MTAISRQNWTLIMWTKVNFKDVAGSIRKNVSTFANEVAKQVSEQSETAESDRHHTLCLPR